MEKHAPAPQLRRQRQRVPHRKRDPGRVHPRGQLGRQGQDAVALGLDGVGNGAGCLWCVVCCGVDVGVGGVRHETRKRERSSVYVCAREGKGQAHPTASFFLPSRPNTNPHKPTCKALAASTNASDSSKPCTSPYARASAKVEPPTAQPKSRARPVGACFIGLFAVWS